MTTIKVKKVSKLNKYPFKLKQDSKTGIILSIHHTIKDNKNILKRIRFTNVAFNDVNQVIIAIDHRGNIFVFDLSNSKFWVLEERLEKCSCAQFVPIRKEQFLAGTKTGHIIIVDINAGIQMFQTKPHNSRIEEITFPTTNKNIFLTMCFDEAVIHDVNSLEKLHRISYTGDTIIKSLMFVPNTDKIVGCFNDDSIRIWSNYKFDPVETIFPLKLKEQYLKTKTVEDIDIRSKEPSNVDCILTSLTKDFSKEQITAICCCITGKNLVLGCLDGFIIILSLTSKTIAKILSLGEISTKLISFLPHSNTLSFLTERGDLVFHDLDKSISTVFVQKQNGYKFKISKNGKMLALVVNSGEVILYNLNVLLEIMSNRKEVLNVLKGSSKIGNRRLNHVQNEIKKTLDKSRLLPILFEYGEYPTKYRQIIWRTLLQLPQNVDAFCELLKKDQHPCVEQIEELYPLKDISALRNLKKVVSCLAHWCNVFAQCDFISTFVFPFLKLNEKNPLLNFETVATIFFNHCQIWFEFAPMGPLNYLGIVENILAFFDNELINFYDRLEVNSKIFAWSLMANAFSEVLDARQWFQLWDHIISNEPWFLVFVIVSYNIIQKSIIMKLSSATAVKMFFHDQNNIDFEKFTSKIYELAEKCPPDLHPSQYMKKFSPLQMGEYQKFYNFPKILIDMKYKQMESLREEKESLKVKMKCFAELEKGFRNKLDNCEKIEEHAKRMKEVEKLYEEALLREEERIAYQRQILLLYQRQLLEREHEAVQGTKDCILRQQISAREQELDKLLRNIERNRIREETDIIVAEENLRIREAELMAKKCNLELIDTQSLSTRYKNAISHLEDEKTKFLNELQRIQTKCENTCTEEININKKIKLIESALKKAQYDFAETMKGTRDRNQMILNGRDLETTITGLEVEVKKLLNQLQIKNMSPSTISNSN